MSITITINYTLPNVQPLTLIVHLTELIMLSGREGKKRVYVISMCLDAGTLKWTIFHL